MAGDGENHGGGQQEQQVPNKRTLWLIRHGLSVHNVEYIERGVAAFEDPERVDTALVEEGKAEAKALGQDIKNRIPVDLDMIVVSPLRRTLQTCDAIFGDRYPQLKITALKCGGVQIKSLMVKIEILVAERYRIFHF